MAVQLRPEAFHGHFAAAPTCPLGVRQRSEIAFVNHVDCRRAGGACRCPSFPRSTAEMTATRQLQQQRQRAAVWHHAYTRWAAATRRRGMAISRWLPPSGTPASRELRTTW